LTVIAATRRLLKLTVASLDVLVEQLEVDVLE